MKLERQKLLDYLGSELKVDTAALDDSTELFSTGLTDSFSMIDLILFIERECGFKVKPLDVNLDNLDSVEKILSFVERSTASPST